MPSIDILLTIGMLTWVTADYEPFTDRMLALKLAATNEEVIL